MFIITNHHDILSIWLASFFWLRNPLYSPKTMIIYIPYISLIIYRNAKKNWPPTCRGTSWSLCRSSCMQRCVSSAKSRWLKGASTGLGGKNLGFLGKNLAGGLNPTPLKNMEWKSVGMMTFPIYGKQCSKPPTRTVSLGKHTCFFGAKMVGC